MTAREFDRFLTWFFNGGSRLRYAAAVFLCICVLVASAGFVGAGISSSVDTNDAIAECDYTGTDGHTYMRERGYRPPGVQGSCRGYDDTLVRAHDWDGAGLEFAKWTMLIGLLGFSLPMTNSLLLGTRGLSRTVRLTWTQSATKRALSERSKRIVAEELSEKAEKETERLERELEALGVRS